MNIEIKLVLPYAEKFWICYYYRNLVPKQPFTVLIVFYGLRDTSSFSKVATLTE